MSGRFQGAHVVIVGAGVAGTAAARALAKEGATVTVSEARPLSQVATADAIWDRGRASLTVTVAPSCTRARAAAVPATPAPTTTTWSPRKRPLIPHLRAR